MSDLLTNWREKLKELVVLSTTEEDMIVEFIESLLKEKEAEVLEEVVRRFQDMPKSESVMPRDEIGYDIAYSEIYSILNSLKNS